MLRKSEKYKRIFSEFLLEAKDILSGNATTIFGDLSGSADRMRLVSEKKFQSDD